MGSTELLRVGVKPGTIEPVRPVKLDNEVAEAEAREDVGEIRLPLVVVSNKTDSEDIVVTGTAAENMVAAGDTDVTETAMELVSSSRVLVAVFCEETENRLVVLVKVDSCVLVDIIVELAVETALWSFVEKAAPDALLATIDDVVLRQLETFKELQEPPKFPLISLMG